MASLASAVDIALREFVLASLTRFSAIRDHKESMAYAGITLFAGATASALVSDKFPPKVWGHSRYLWALLALSALWLIVLSYLRYQLRRRRWAALRVAGCDWLLASWLPGSPLAEDKDWAANVSRERRPSPALRTLDFFWPMDHAVAAIDPRVRVYPPVLEQSWLKAELRGSDALDHERLIHAAGWLLWIVASLQLYWRAAY